MEGTHQGRSWKHALKKMAENKERWCGLSDFQIAKKAKRRRKRMYDGIKRKSIYMRDGKKCRDCEKLLGPEEYIIGHIVPLADGGTNHPKNLITVCQDCEDKRHGVIRKVKKASDQFTLSGPSSAHDGA
jgi:hypothetical protein